MIHDVFSPMPDFDVRKFVMSIEVNVLVIKIEEGLMPPYITSRGKIYERFYRRKYIGTQLLKELLKQLKAYDTGKQKAEKVLVVSSEIEEKAYDDLKIQFTRQKSICML